jgi:hypothetical protein
VKKERDAGATTARADAVHRAATVNAKVGVAPVPAARDRGVRDPRDVTATARVRRAAKAVKVPDATTGARVPVANAPGVVRVARAGATTAAVSRNAANPRCRCRKSP